MSITVDGTHPTGMHSCAEHVSTTQTQIQIRIPFTNGYCTHFWDGSLSLGQIFVPITYILIRGSESESEPMENSCIVQASLSESESESESGNGNKGLDLFVPRKCSFKESSSLSSSAIAVAMALSRRGVHSKEAPAPMREFARRYFNNAYNERSNPQVNLKPLR